MRSWRRYLRFWGPNVDADVDDELQFHIDMLARSYEAQGMSSTAAHRAATQRFGDVQSIGGTLREHDHRKVRQHNRRELMSDFVHDLRFGLRSLRRTPAFSVVAIVTLALGIGATTAIFSVVNGVILRPLPYRDPGRVAMIWMDNRRQGMREDIHSWPNLVDLKARNASFERIAAYYTTGLNVTGGCPANTCEPQRVGAIAATADLFPVLGVSPRIGRAFTAEEEEPGRDDVVILSDGLWRQLGADAGVIGTKVQLNGRPRTVVGIMPAGFAFPTPDTDVWIPLALDPDEKAARQSFGFYAVGRIKAGATIESAQRDMSVQMKRLEQEYPGNRDLGAYIVSLSDQIVGKSLRTALWIILGAVAAVLLIACANVANLQLGRAASREREVGVRLALGANRTRLIRQLLTESMLLSMLGGIVGVFLAWVGLRVLIGLAPTDIPRLDAVRIDGLVLATTLIVTLATGILFGLMPALQSSRPDLGSALREGSRGTGGQRGQRVRRVLAAGQVALVVVLLTAAGLLIRSFQQLQQVQLGFRPDHLLTMQLALSGAKYPTPAARMALFESLLEKVRATPGVLSAGAITDIFLSQTPNSTNFTIEGRTRTTDLANVEIPLDAVTPDYFKTMGIPVIRGRAFTSADGVGDSTAQQVVIINANMAKRFWPNEDPIGKRFKYGGDANGAGGGPWMTIVGVVGDMRRTGYDAPVRYETFLPYPERPTGRMTLVVRTSGEPLAMTSAVRAQLRALDPQQPVYGVSSMDQLLSGMIAQRRFSMALLGTFAALALVLGVVGVYGVTSYLVAQRTREVGLRLALGAQPQQVVLMVVRQGLATAAAGLVVGLLAALATTRLMGTMLYGVSPTDVATLLGVTLTLAVATLFANYLPARRAARVDPLVALRSE